MSTDVPLKRTPAPTADTAVRLQFSLSDQVIISSIYISCLVLLSFILTGFYLHRNAVDDRLRGFQTSKLFSIHIFGCLLLGIFGLFSTFFGSTTFNAFNCFLLFLLVIYYNHVGCLKYGHPYIVSICCGSKFKKNVCFKICFDTKFRVNLIFSFLLVIIAMVWWVIHLLNAPNIQNSNDRLTDDSFFLIILISMTLFHTLFSSIYSRISISGFVALFIVFIFFLLKIGVLHNDLPSWNELLGVLVSWLVILFTVTSTISFFSCSQHLKLQLISISLISGFLSIFDLLTDLLLIIQWSQEGKWLVVIIQIMFILSGTIFSAYFIKRFYYKEDGNNKCIAQSLTFIGLGRLWHGISAWDSHTRSYVMLLGSKTIKIWEMFLESYPSIFLQLWIILSEYDSAPNAVVWSMAVSVASISFVVLRILFCDHRKRREDISQLQDEQEDNLHVILEANVLRAESEQIQKTIKKIEKLQSYSSERSNAAFDSKTTVSSNPSLVPLTTMESVDNNAKNLYKQQEERKKKLLERRRKGREAKLADSMVTILFERKPLGCTLYRGEEEKNAWIADIKETNKHISDGLYIGLYVHTINGAIVDNMPYYTILDKVKHTSAPLTIGFNSYPPIKEYDHAIVRLTKMGYSFKLLQCAWQELNKFDKNITIENLEFEGKMVEILSKFGEEDQRFEEDDLMQEEEKEIVDLDNFMDSNPHLMADFDDEFNDDDEKYGSDDEVSLCGYYYTQTGLMTDFGDEKLNDFDEKLAEELGSDDDNFVNIQMPNKNNQQYMTKGAVTKGNADDDDTTWMNTYEKFNLVQPPNRDDLIVVDFKRKPLGFDREAGSIDERNCKVKRVHSIKLSTVFDLAVGYYIRRINDKFVAGSKFSKIENMLRNTPCPMTIVFRQDEPPFPPALLEKIREKERFKQKDMAKRMSASKKMKLEEHSDERDELFNPLRMSMNGAFSDELEEEITVQYDDQNDLLFTAGPGDENNAWPCNAKITTLKVDLLSKGVRLGMFVHKINENVMDNLPYNDIYAALNCLHIPFNITFRIYKPIDYHHPSIQFFLNKDYSKDDIENAWKIINRQKIDNVLTFDDDSFIKEMSDCLQSQAENRDKFYQKVNKNRNENPLLGKDLDTTKPITIYFTKRPLGFEIISGDELTDGKNAKISLITNDQYRSIGLQRGLLIHEINGDVMDNLPFSKITTKLKTEPLPITVNFVKSIALSFSEYVVVRTFDKRPFPFSIKKCAASSTKYRDNAVIDKIVGNNMMNGVKKGMHLHNINGIGVMHNMKFNDLRDMLQRFELPIDIGFIDMAKVENKEKKKKESKSKKKNAKPKEKEKKVNTESDIMGEIKKKKKRKMTQEEKLELRAIAEKEHEEAWKCGCCCNFMSCCAPSNVSTWKCAYYLIFYVFTITDMYCRIYPILLVPAYTYRSAEDGNYLSVFLAWFFPLLVVLSFEAILYKNILMPGYSSWTTVFRQLYFATFTISFFLMSTMGLAYLERNVDFKKLLKWEFTGRMIIGFCSVMIIHIHQYLNIPEYEEWLFQITLIGYYFVLIAAAGSGFALFFIQKVKGQML